MENIELDKEYISIEETTNKKKNKLEDDNWIRDTEKVEFLNTETPGLTIKFVYGSTKNPQKYTLFHGGVYDLPKKVIRHLESCGTPIYTYAPDGNGRMIKTPKGFIPRFSLRRR